MNNTAPPDFGGNQACAGHGDLFATNTRRTETRKRDICRRCPCLIDCFTWAVENAPFEFWAGYSPTERSRIRADYGIEPTFDSTGHPRQLENA